MPEPTPIDTPEFRAWLRRIVHRHVRRYLRRERWQRWRLWLTYGLHDDSDKDTHRQPDRSNRNLL